MNPKLSLGSWAFVFGTFSQNPWSFQQVLEYCHNAGYDGVEISGFDPHPSHSRLKTKRERNELINLIDSYNLGISAYAPNLESFPPSLIESENYIDEFKRCIEFAVDLNTRVIRIDSASPPEYFTSNEYARRFERLTNTWRQSAELAAEVGLKVVWEFEPGFWLNKPSEVKRLVTSVNHPAFQVMFDTSHAYMSGVVGARQVGEKEILNGGVSEYAALLKGQIGAFHIIDSDGTLHDAETSTHAQFGNGFIDFKQTITSMREDLSLLEWWCVDFCFNSEVEAWGKQAIPIVRNILKEVS